MASNGQLAHQPSSPTSHYGNLPHWTSNVSRGIKRLFPPVNGKSLLRHYVPLGGSLSHSLFTMHIFAPSIFARVFSVYDLAASNIILFNAHLGLGFYIYFRPHMHRLWRWRRVEFSVLATVMFNFGSLLLSIFVKDLLPKKLRQFQRCIVGLALSFFLLHRARRYVTYIDQRALLPSLNELKNATQNGLQQEKQQRERGKIFSS